MKTIGLLVLGAAVCSISETGRLAAHSSATERERAEGELSRVVRGTYTISRVHGVGGTSEVIGTESFSKEYLTDNRIILESERQLNFAQDRFIRTAYRMVVEEEFWFPKRYEMREEVGGVVQQALEVDIEMFANVAVITSRRNDQEERDVRVLSTGAMFVQANQINQLALLLNRFSFASKVRQNINVFDPLKEIEGTATIEYAGEDSTTIDGVGKRLKLYKIRRDKSPEVRLHVDDDGNVVKTEDGIFEYILTSFEEEYP